MPYYVGRNENGIISWSSRQADAKPFTFYGYAVYFAEKLAHKINDRTVEVITKPKLNLN